MRRREKDIHIYFYIHIIIFKQITWPNRRAKRDSDRPARLARESSPASMGEIQIAIPPGKLLCVRERERDINIKWLENVSYVTRNRLTLV